LTSKDTDLIYYVSSLPIRNMESGVRSKFTLHWYRMNRNPVKVVLATSLMTAVLSGAAVTEAEVRRVHEQAILIDTHNDVTSETVKGLDLGARRRTGHTDIPRLREGGVDAQFFAAYVAASYARQGKAAERARAMIATIRQDIAARHSDHFVLALSAADIEQAARQGKIAALIGIEGGHAIEDSLEKLREFYGLGVRYMTLTHSNTNNWADSSGDKPRHGGLAAFGQAVVREMNHLGMMVDISHVSDGTFWDVLETSRAPVFASHSSSRALAGIPRNMTDDMIRALAKKGGVVQINFGCDFLSQGYVDARRRKQKTPPATLADVVAHIDHVVKIAGIDAVGLGSDFDGVTCVPTGLSDVAQFPNLTRALLEKGYTPEQIYKIYGGNTLRLMRAVEQMRGK
jgi:membrane dipeptidase